jgi:threonine dehydratase
VFDLPALEDAARLVHAVFPPTPQFAWPLLAARTGAEVWVKHENHLPTAAFKVRGGINLAAQLSTTEREAGLIAASTGNHGQSISFAAQLFDVAATICVPANANPTKVESMQAYGAKIIAEGRDFDDARENAERLSRENGYRYVHSGDEPLLIAGVGTYALEILEEQPDIDTILVPIGGGSGAAGTCIVAKGVRPEIEVIGVQASAAPAAYRSWKARELVEDQMGTAAEGLATRTAFALPQRILWDLLDDFVLVDEEQLADATFEMIKHTRNLVEAAGASSLAGALAIADRLHGRKVAVICSGGNISPAQLKELLESRA